MLPLDERWYRRLLGIALGLGAVAGIFALVFHVVTGRSMGLFFGEPSSEPFSGQWWWIPLISAGALLVAVLRARAGVAGHVPGAVAFAMKGWVDPATAVQLVLISTISLMLGASLGPSFAVIVAGGGFAAWLVSRQKDADEGERHDYALTGMAGALGSVFSAPLLGAAMISELSPTTKRDYVSSFFPQLIAATIGFVIFFGITGSVLLDSFEVPGYEFEYWHLLAAIGLGLLSTLVMVAFVSISGLVRRASTLLPNAYVRAALFGALVGLIAFALPLTVTGGGAQLAYATANLTTLGAGLLVVVLLAKIAAVALSLQAGFLGGPVFPLFFLGGTAGVVVHDLVPGIPASLAVAAMLAAVPGAVVGAPIGFILIGIGGVGLGIEGAAPVGIAVITSSVAASALQLHKKHGEM